VLLSPCPPHRTQQVAGTSQKRSERNVKATTSTAGRHARAKDPHYTHVEKRRGGEGAKQGRTPRTGPAKMPHTPTQDRCLRQTCSTSGARKTMTSTPPAARANQMHGSPPHRSARSDRSTLRRGLAHGTNHCAAATRLRHCPHSKHHVPGAERAQNIGAEADSEGSEIPIVDRQERLEQHAPLDVKPLGQA